MRRALILGAFLSAVCGAGLAGETVKLDVPLTIHDAAGVERKGEVCSTGVPLPCGLLKEPKEIAVFSAGGRTVPAQFKVLERWREKAAGKDDLSIKWLLVTFLADVPKGGKAVYHLRPGKNPAPAKPVKILKKGEDYKLGGLLFKKDFSSPFKLVLTDAEGKEISASELPVKLSVYEQGPVRACLKAESITVPAKFGFTAWIYAYAGQKRWDMTLTLNNTPRKVQGPLYIKDFSVIWEPPELKGAKEGLLGGEAGKAVKTSATAYLYQASDGTEKWNTMERWRSEFVMDWSKEKKLRMAGVPSFRGYKAMAGGKESGAGNSALGWVALNGGGKGALVRLRHFKQNYPKAVELKPGSLVVRLWPKYYKGYGGLQWLDDATRKDHTLSFTLKDGPVSPEEGEAAAKAFNARLVAHCGPDWYRRSGVYRPGPRRYPARHTGPDPRPWGRVANRNWVTFGGDVSDRIRRRYHGYGMGPFLGTGNPYHAYILTAYARHSGGMTPLWADDYQYPRDAKTFTHRQYCGTARGVGKYRPGTGHHGFKAWNDAHFCCQEIFDDWRLSGDPVAEDALRKIGHWCMAFVADREKGLGLVAGTRADGLPLHNLCEAYRITGDPEMLKMLHRFADVSWKQVNKQRGNYGVMGSWEGGRDKCEKPFMMAQVMGGIRGYYQLTGDERTMDQFLGMADFILAESSIGPWGFSYVVLIDPEKQKAKHTEFRAKADKDGRHVSYGNLSWVMAWAYLQTGAPRFRKSCDGLSKKAYPHTDFTYLRHYPERSDKDAPAAVKDLAAEAQGGGKVKLTWTAPAGAPVRYQVKWAANPMLERIDWRKQAKTHANWWAARNVPGEPKPKAGKQSMIVEGVSAGKRHFALRSWDAANNRSAMSNMVAVEVK